LFYKGKKIRGSIGPSSDLHGYGGRIREELSKHIAPVTDLRVLDVGTGLAGNAEFLARRLTKGSRIWTLDPSREVLSKARTALRAERLSAKVEFVRGTIDRVEFEDEFFDIVVSVMALHHMSELRPAIAEMVRVLRTDGKILLADYKPRAADELEFRSVHHAGDFFSMNEVKSVLGNQGIVTDASDFDLWYLVVGRKHH
jgi:ubiquinone/menaquinone biosynthesis C-methylase UbiE